MYHIQCISSQAIIYSFMQILSLPGNLQRHRPTRITKPHHVTAPLSSITQYNNTCTVFQYMCSKSRYSLHVHITNQQKVPLVELSLQSKILSYRRLTDHSCWEYKGIQPCTPTIPISRLYNTASSPELKEQVRPPHYKPK